MKICGFSVLCVTVLREISSKTKSATVDSLYKLNTHQGELKSVRVKKSNKRGNLTARQLNNLFEVWRFRVIEGRSIVIFVCRGVSMGGLRVLEPPLFNILMEEIGKMLCGNRGEFGVIL